MRAQQDVRLAGDGGLLAGEVADVERVRQAARGVVRRRVERGEVVVVQLDFRAFRDVIAEADEDVGDLAHHLVDEVDVTRRAPASRQRHVDRLRGDPRLQGGRAEDPAPLVQRRFERGSDLVRDLAHRWPLLCRQPAEAAEDRRERALLAEVRHAHGLESREVARRGRLGDARRLQRSKIIRDAHA